MDYVRKVPQRSSGFAACTGRYTTQHMVHVYRGFQPFLQESRGRWNSLDCLLAFGWCGSAVVGGFLLDKFGFDLTFIITASAQVSLALNVRLLCFQHAVPVELPSSSQELGSAVAANTSRGATSAQQRLE